VVQDAFVRLFGRFRDIRRPESFEWYLQRTVVNLCRDRQRRIRSERARDLRLASELRRSPTGPSGTDSDVLELIRALPHRQKAVLVLRFFDDLSVEDTAKLLGCSDSAIKSLTNRAMNSIREATMEGERWTI
jgi:RNA polymerase sigma factor (sigma-70 family)